MRPAQDKIGDRSTAAGRTNLPMIGKLLGHALVASTARYAHFDDDHLLEATESIGAAIEKAMLTGSF